MEVLTAHAKVRMQKRGIDPDALERLLDWGIERHDHHGAVVVYLDKAAQRRLRHTADTPTRKSVDRLAHMYAVVASDGEVVTVGHRYRRIRRAA